MKKSLRVFYKVLMVKIILMAMLFAAITIPQDKILISRAAKHFTRDTDYQVDLGTIHGDLFSSFRIDRLSLSDKNGVWLSIDALHIKWHPLALATGGHVLDRIKAQTIDLSRLPDTPKKKEEPNKEETAFDLQKTLRFVPFDIMLPSVSLGGSIAGSQQHLEIYTHKKDGRYRALIRNLQGPETSLLADLGLKPGDIDGQFSFREAAGGLVGHLAKLPEHSALSAEATLQTDYKKTTHLEQATIHLGPSTLVASGSFNHDTKESDATLTATIPHLSDFSSLAGMPLSGDVTVKLNIAGPQNNLKTDLSVYSPQIGLETLLITPAKIETNGILDLSFPKNPLFDMNGNILFGLQPKGKDDKPYTIKTDYNVKGDIHHFAATTSLDATTPYGSSTADVTATIDLLNKLYSGEITGQATSGKHTYTLEAATTASPQKIDLTRIDLKGTGAVITGNLNWQMQQKLANGKLTVDIENLKPLADIAALPLTGTFKMDADLDSAGDTQLADITIDKMNITYADKTVRLQDKAKLNVEDKRAELSPTTLLVAGGTLTASGHLDPDTVSASLKIKQLKLNDLVETDLFKGQLNGDVSISGSTHNPDIKTNATIQGQSGTNPVKLDMKGNWQQGTLLVQAKAASTQTDATLKATIKSELSLLPFKTDFSADTPINGDVTAKMDLSVLNTLLWASRQQVNGDVSGRMAIKGRISDPRLSGKFNLSNASYKHTVSGICMNNVSAVILGNNDTVVLQELSSRNSSKGVLSAKARIGLTGRKALNGGINFDNYRLFCGGLATGVLDGALRASGTMQSSLIDGKLTLGPLNVQLPGAQNEAGIPQVETIRINDRKNGSETSPSVLRLNITLDAPGRIFVRGRGLDAEFEGNLAITGQANDPFINGSFEARRGKFALLDRTLDLKKAVMRFEGKVPPSPYLDISAESKVQSTTITVNLAGQAIKPKLTLSSQPSLPQDEVLALLLFGRQLQNISPFEALKLAQAARTLAGMDGGEPGILDRARSTLGLDTLDVGTNADNDVTVSTGKYVTDSVFVGVQQGAKPEDKRVKTEIELAPSVSANTTMDAEGNQGIGLGWRHDY